MVNNYNRALGEIFEGNLSTLILGPFSSPMRRVKVKVVRNPGLAKPTEYLFVGNEPS
jgi:hypothetical protein